MKTLPTNYHHRFIITERVWSPRGMHGAQYLVRAVRLLVSRPSASIVAELHSVRLGPLRVVGAALRLHRLHRHELIKLNLKTNLIDHHFLLNYYNTDKSYQ
jgi:hypothetical protein